MTRFDAATPADRASLIVAAIRAHRERESPFLTVETDPQDEPGPAPWIQFRQPEGQLNLDCTAAELDSIRAAIDGFGGVSVTEQHDVEDGGINLRIAVPGDDQRVAQVIETLFCDGFGLPESYRLWVTVL